MKSNEATLSKQMHFADLCPASRAPSQPRTPLLSNAFICNDLISVKETDSKRHGLGQEPEIPVPRDVDSAKLPNVLVHDLGVEEAVSPRVQPADK